MILIWCNGGSWSDKRIYFVDAGDRANELSAALTNVRPWSGDPYTIAIVESVEWRAPKALMSVGSFVSDVLDSLSHADDCEGESWGPPCACPVGELRRAFEKTEAK
jgi:hypothetical protein